MKVNLHIKLDGEEKLDFKVKAIKTKDSYKYKENDITVTLNYNDSKVQMKRVCNDYDILLIFDKDKESISKYSVFGNKKIFLLNTRTSKLNIHPKLIEIDYNLEGNDFKYVLEEL